MSDESLHDSSTYSFQTDGDTSSSPSRVTPFISKLEYSEHEMGPMEAVDNLLNNPLVEKELGQFWPINKYDGITLFVCCILCHSGVNFIKVL